MPLVGLAGWLDPMQTTMVMGGRLMTMAPALVVLAVGFDPTKSLVASQVVLSFGIPFALVPLLARAKARAGDALSSSATKGEGRQNMLCAYLSVALLLGLGANALFGLWWADPVTALVIAGVAIKEGRESWRGEACCAADAGLGAASSAACCSDPHCSCCQHE